MIAVITPAGRINLPQAEHAEEPGEHVDTGADGHAEAGDSEATGGHGSESVEAPNPILPATNEVIWGTISFVILLVLMVRFAFPALNKAMEARTNRIREDLDEATRARTEAQTVLEEYQRQLADARSEANRIIEEARQTADQLRRDLMARAESEAADLRQRARDDIEAAKSRAIADLRSEVSGIAIDLAEKVVGQNLDRQTNQALVESFINQLATRS